MNPKISMLIVDLDNTLFDWFEIWYATFQPIHAGLLRHLPIDRDALDPAIRRIHQKRRTSEYTFLLDELNTDLPTTKNLRELLTNEIAESKKARDLTLKLYPTVLRTLWEIKRRGTRIVAYTESLSFYSAYRLKKLGLDGVIDFLYSPPDHDLPVGISINKIRSLPEDFYQLNITEIRHTPPGEIKPNPKLLKAIVADFNTPVSECLYIGDSLFKDVAMAQDAGLHDVYAEYGAASQRTEYDLLRSVSHWTDEDVEREKAATKRNVKPTLSVETFSEVLRYFDFVSASPKVGDLNVNNIIEIWKKVVDVQQHFNQIEIQIRNFALTVTGAIMAAGGITFRDGLTAKLFGMDVSLSLGLAVIAAAVWGGFWFMDRHWYHRMLKGAVDHAASLESRFQSSIPEIGLGKSISAASPLNIFGISLNSNKKINLFYGIGAIVIIGFGSFAAISTSQKASLGPPSTLTKPSIVESETAPTPTMP